MTIVYDPVKCPDCSTWWRSETHKCLLTVTAAMVQPVVQEQLEITRQRKKRTKIVRSNSFRKWEPKDEALLISLLKRKPQLSYDTIGKMMGRSSRGIDSRITILKRKGLFSD